MEMSGRLHAPAALLPVKGPQVPHWIQGWVGPRIGLDRLDDVEMRKVLSIPALELRPSGRPARRRTDCAIPAPHETLFKSLL
jgi:hypothetical protein